VVDEEPCATLQAHLPLAELLRAPARHRNERVSAAAAAAAATQAEAVLALCARLAARSRDAAVVLAERALPSALVDLAAALDRGGFSGARGAPALSHLVLVLCPVDASV
jgi:hypothetical protein